MLLVFRRALVAALTLPALAMMSAPPSSASALATAAFTQLAPTRVVDTRIGLGATKGPLANATRVRVPLRELHGIAASATAVALNVTIVNATQPGFVSLWGGPADSLPTVSTVNAARAGQTVANMAVITLSEDGTANLFTNAGGDILIDVAGFWSPATSAKAGRYNAIKPVRALDTRDTDRLAAGGTATVKVVGIAGIPADASAVVITVTATQAEGAGYVTAYPSGIAVPDTSTLNVPATGATVPNQAIVPIGADGTISLYSTMATDLIVDAAGWFSGAASDASADGLFVPISAVRLADSRLVSDTPPLGADLPEEIAVRGGDMPTTGVSAVALNVTLIATLDDGFATISPSGASVPNTSNLNFHRGDTVAGASLARIGANRTVTVTSSSSADVIVDAVGYFTGDPAPNEHVHPTACRDLAIYVEFVSGPSDYYARLRDRTGRNPDVTVDSGFTSAELAPNCAYMLTTRLYGDGRRVVTRFSLTGRKMSSLPP